MTNLDFPHLMSDLCGWGYFAAWSYSFYPQVYRNWQNKSVEGYKLDYPVLNFTGFLFYAIIYTVGFFGQHDNPYNNYGLGTVRVQDLVFALHAFLLVFVIGYQCIIYPKGKNKLSTFSHIMNPIAFISAIAVYLFTEVWVVIQPTEQFNYVLFLGYWKLVITIVKYFPQGYWHYKTKSTEGWSIYCSLFDLTGGALSIAQNIIDLNDGTTDSLNPIKFWLGNITLLYDFVFIFQHYCLYNEENRKKYRDLEDSSNSVNEMPDLKQTPLSEPNGI